MKIDEDLPSMSSVRLASVKATFKRWRFSELKKTKLSKPTSGKKSTCRRKKRVIKVKLSVNVLPSATAVDLVEAPINRVVVS